MRHSAWIGIDFGTTGCRICAIDSTDTIVAQQQHNFTTNTQHYPSPQQQAIFLHNTLHQLLSHIPDFDIEAIAIDATSGSVMLCDLQGEPLSEMLMYDDQRAQQTSQHIAAMIPANSAAHGVGSGLSKLCYLQGALPLPKKYYLLHQADWLAIQLGGKLGISDYNNALKSGFDVVENCWPEWLKLLTPQHVLPQVVAPGTIIGKLPDLLMQQYGLKQAHSPLIKAGTTDSLAAFIATGANKLGDAVTSLGSTLVLKLICQKPIFDAERGIYSHKLGNRWLCGGASNSGGSVLKQFFSDQQLMLLSQKIDLQQSPPNYYPLLKPGERFPIADPNYSPQIAPRPVLEHQFLHGLLIGIARIEKAGYEYLQQLSEIPLTSIRSVGGGAKNTMWTQLRQSLLPVPFKPAKQTDAAFGSALLARYGLILFQ